MWFSCTDVAKAVGYENAQNAVSTLMVDRKELSEIEPPLSIGRVGFSGVGVFSHPLGLRDAVSIL